MAFTDNQSNLHWSRKPTYYTSILLVVSVAVTLAALVLPQFTQLATSPLEVGKVASKDIVAPRSLTYPSEILTERQREAAANAIPSVYSSPDTRIARQQLERLRASLAYIASIRADAFATPGQKESDLAALEDIHLNRDTAQGLLALSDARWQVIQQEAITVLEQVMRSAIREDRLDDARRNVPTLISLALPEDQARIVAELVSGFVEPNSFYSQELTETARNQARESVTPINRSFVQGETILQRGRVASALDLEALAQFGLIPTLGRWQDFAGAVSITILLVIYILIYIRRNPGLSRDFRGLTLIIVLFLITLLGGRFVAQGQPILSYLYPLSAFGLIVASLFGSKIALIFTVPLVILYAYGLPNAFEIILYNLLGSFFGILALGTARRVTSFFWAAGAIAFAEMTVIIATRLPQPDLDVLNLAAMFGVTIFNGIASSSLTLLLQYFLAQLMGMTTALQLLEISRPDHPLLQFILRQAPGTYQHSLQVANLAEQAAERIGADPLLTRVGAIYHDAGKALNPFYFIENQLPGSPNPHDGLDPVTSAGIILRHVTDGLELAHKYRLPRRIQNFIAEHHGTMIAHYQYVRAIETAGGDESLVDEANFRYPGPKPQSRETAILMLADGSEARMRAERPIDEFELSALIKNVVENRLTTGQLDHTDLTLRDLDAIIDSFTATLRGTYHPRLAYPKLERVNAPRPDSTPTVPITSRSPAEIPANTQADSSSHP